ncbi:MAG: hypothetical protein K8R92_04465 [Planctomycetes bacterium]|nr:hypothetical protein [Planctomycetota bacterium]
MSNSMLVIAFTFLSMGAVAVLMWKLVQKQEQQDPDFEQKLAADDRRARANRQAASKAASPKPADPQGKK